MADKKQEVPCWDLGDLYKGIDDPAVKRAMKRGLKEAEEFAKKYKGKLPRAIKSAAALKKALVWYDQISVSVAKPVIFAQLKYSECPEDPARGAFLQEVRGKYKDVSNLLVFFKLELLALPQRQLRSYIKAPGLKPFGYYLQLLLQSKQHRLEEREEQLLSEKGLTGAAAFARLYSEEHAAARYKFGTKELTQSEVLDLLYDSSRRTRIKAAGSVSTGLADNSRRMAFIYNNLMQDKSVNDRWRKYKSAETARHMSNQTEQRVVDTMVKTIVEHYPLVHEFYKYKKKLLGYKKLYDYDRYAPISSRAKTYEFAEAKELILEAFGEFSPRYRELSEDFFDKNWIDAEMREGKQSGGFCSFVTPDKHPYILVNYTGSLREVLTVAHELGHGMHARLMNKLPFAYFDVPLTTAETASIFSEMFVFDFLKGKVKSKKELQGLYIAKIENIFATVFRQTTMYRFEQDLHARRKKGEVPVPEINELWLRNQQEMFGRSVELTEDYGYWWSYIPHFIHTPFYVYAYAFGELLALSLYARYKKEKEAGKAEKSFIPNYFALLEAGGSKSPEQLVKPFGINLRTKKFWKEGLSVIEGMIDEMKGL